MGYGLEPQLQTVQQKRRVTSTNAAKPVRAARIPPTASNSQKQKGGPVIGKAKAVKRVAKGFRIWGLVLANLH